MEVAMVVVTDGAVDADDLKSFWNRMRNDQLWGSGLDLLVGAKLRTIFVKEDDGVQPVALLVSFDLADLAGIDVDLLQICISLGLAKKDLGLLAIAQNHLESPNVVGVFRVFLPVEACDLDGVLRWHVVKVFLVGPDEVLILVSNSEQRYPLQGSPGIVDQKAVFVEVTVLVSVFPELFDLFLLEVVE